MCGPAIRSTFVDTKWSTFRELLLPARRERGNGRWLENALRDAVRSGRLAAGTRLPSTRDLAGQLGTARGTVTTAYTQLVAEGYLTARGGSGTTVAAAIAPVAPAAAGGATPGRRAWRYDLRTGLPALGAFPRAEWVAATRAGLGTLSDAELGYPDPAGLPVLRSELASYLGRVRAVSATAADIVITSGAAEGFALLAAVLLARGDPRLGTEDPGHREQTEQLGKHGLDIVRIPVDDGGLQVGPLRASGARAVLVTAAHQFPLGMPLHPSRRHELLAWAADAGGLICEDDYDAEHRYDRPALAAVQALDPRRVVYLGTVSKTLAPALRIGWLVAPPALRAGLVEAKRMHDLGCSPLPQAALAQLLRTGGYDRHLRRTRTLYRRRRDALLAAVGARLPGWRAVGVAAGLHVVLRLPDGIDDAALAAAAADAGVNVAALSSYASTGAAPFPGLVVGYGATSPDRLRAAVDVIAGCVGALRRSA